MGSLTLPESGTVYADAQIFIYSVEKHPTYSPLLRPLWEAVQAGKLEVVSSELTLMETLVGPIKKADQALISTYDRLYEQAGVRLLPITRGILRQAADPRATTTLRTPDAIHAATCIATGCAMFLTNDSRFRSMKNVPIVMLDDLAS